jgi:hypothetical protein
LPVTKLYSQSQLASDSEAAKMKKARNPWMQAPVALADDEAMVISMVSRGSDLSFFGYSKS